ncbi:MAG: hypothetical protein Q9160_002085 [Pyrenula sp. 1 TL-2023]
MDGPMPDPSTLDAEGDDDVVRPAYTKMFFIYSRCKPLHIVQEKAKIERANSQRVSSAPHPAQPLRQAAAPAIDLFGDDAPITPPVRPSTTDIPSKPQPKPATQPARQTKPGDSLLGLDFFGNSQPSTGRPSSATSNPLASTASSRPDLKQSILSLYASAPKPQQQIQPQPQPSPHNRQPSYGGLSSPPQTSPPPRADAFGGLTDAFSGLNFPSQASPPPQPKQQPSFSGLGSLAPSISTKSAPSAPKVTSPPPLSGGSFFDSAPSTTFVEPKSPPVPARAPSNGLDFAFAQSPPPPPKSSSASKPPPNDIFGDFDDFASPAPAPSPAPVPAAPPPSKVSSPPADNSNSAFNLSAPAAPISKPAAPKPPLVAQNSSAMFDPWSSGNDNAWSTEAAPAPPPKPRAPSIGRPPAHITPGDFGAGWGSSAPKAAEAAPKVTADEDFGGWTSASTPQTTTSTNQSSKPSGGFGGNDDLFSNVWE